VPLDPKPGLFWKRVPWSAHEGDGVEELGTDQSEQQHRGLEKVLAHHDLMRLHHRSPPSRTPSR